MLEKEREEEVLEEGLKAMKTVKATKTNIHPYAKATLLLVLKRLKVLLNSVTSLLNCFVASAIALLLFVPPFQRTKNSFTYNYYFFGEKKNTTELNVGERERERKVVLKLMGIAERERCLCKEGTCV